MLENVDFAKYGDGEAKMTKYNIAGIEEITNLGLAERVAKLMNRDLKYKLVDFHSTRAGHDLRYALDSNKIRSEGWQPPIGLDVTLQETIAHVIGNPSWQE
jgi:dTDP-glucose 4,6-dehydratase